LLATSKASDFPFLMHPNESPLCNSESEVNVRRKENLINLDILFAIDGNIPK